MSYTIVYSTKADADIADLKRSNTPAFHKLLKLIKELYEHPQSGTGKPELMKHGKYKGLWSRRISGIHRLVYSINDNEIMVLIVSAKDHYNDR